MKKLLQAIGIILFSAIALILPVGGTLSIIGISLSFEDALCTSILLIFIVLVLTSALISLNDLIKSDLS